MPTDKEREQWRTYSRKYRAAHPARWRDVRQKYNARKVAFIREAKNKPCADCSNRFPFYVMQFDHVRGKKLFTVGAHKAEDGFGFKALAAEIEKCDVVCANCHAERTYSRL